ncbi:hypothetical protein [Clostridium perfringens]|uniref:hypothetical protein n=1 Tax=Clostridium perfringens TaxID=1502 RepID=UPI0024BC1822|nr:hypothetical protein [Clostridium perfringens]MDK0822922.1 hypothetical protein [Clostridium perfringens]MDZ5026016.1 hypothetical protein [Clostridium perfringens]
MKFNNKILSFLIVIYVATIIFNGLLTKIAIDFGFLSFKKILPEVILIIILTILTINIFLKKKINLNIFFIAACFYIFNFIFQCISIDDGKIFYAIRDNLLPFILLFLIMNNSFNINEKKILMRKLTALIKIFLISGFILALLEFILGWKWTSIFYTGIPFYGRDEASGIMIWQIGKYLRVPSVTGDSVIFAISNFFAFFLIDISNQKKIYKFLAVVNIILSTSRTILIVLIVYIFIKFLLENTKNFNFIRKNMLIILTITIFIIAVVLFILIYCNNNTLGSLYERINGVWKNIFINLNLKEFLLGKGVFEIGSGMNNYLANNYEYFYIYSFVDNTILYLILSYGIIGSLLFILINFKVIKISLKLNDLKYMSFILASMIGSLTINYMQGRSYIYLYFIFFIFIGCNKEDLYGENT